MMPGCVALDRISVALSNDGVRAGVMAKLLPRLMDYLASVWGGPDYATLEED